MESALVLQVVAGGLTMLVVTAVLFAWARSIARKRDGAWWGIAAWLSPLALALNLGGLAISIAMLVHAFDVVAVVSAAERARVLGARISEAMTMSALLVGPAWILYAVVLVSCLVGSLRPLGPRALSNG